MPGISAAGRAERVVYRIAGLPVAIRARFGRERDPLRLAFSRRYFQPQDAGEWAELLLGMITWPIAVPVGALWFTLRNGAIIAKRSGRSAAAQFADQIRLYFSDGVLAPWYYIFSLYEPEGRRRAPTYLQRFETKPVLFKMLKGFKGTPLNDKARFAAYCAEHGVRCAPVIANLSGGPLAAPLPDCDLFVKPLDGRGGKGAERWDLAGPSLFQNPAGERLTDSELRERLVERSRNQQLVIQPRLRPDPDLTPLTTGALPTVRIVTCLDERGEPEVIGAVFRMSVGGNVTVDNLHAGGIAANVSLPSGELSRATNLGADARLGWLTNHPDTGTPIEGHRLPLWEATKQLAADAHRHFSDRVVIGWDVAITDDGPVIIEGNGNSDMDILQRFMCRGLREHRFGELLAFHLKARGALSA